MFRDLRIAVGEFCPYALHSVTELAELTSEKLVGDIDTDSCDDINIEEDDEEDDFVLVKSNSDMKGVCFF